MGKELSTPVVQDLHKDAEIRGYAQGESIDPFHAEKPRWALRVP